MNHGCLEEKPTKKHLKVVEALRKGDSVVLATPSTCTQSSHFPKPSQDRQHFPLIDTSFKLVCLSLKHLSFCIVSNLLKCHYCPFLWASSLFWFSFTRGKSSIQGCTIVARWLVGSWSVASQWICILVSLSLVLWRGQSSK
jgi:hypothetical protein